MINPLQTKTGGFEHYYYKKRMKSMERRFPQLQERIKALKSEITELEKVNAKLTAINEALSSIIKDSLKTEELASLRTLKRVAKKVKVTKGGNTDDGPGNDV